MTEQTRNMRKELGLLADTLVRLPPKAITRQLLDEIIQTLRNGEDYAMALEDQIRYFRSLA